MKHSAVAALVPGFTLIATLGLAQAVPSLTVAEVTWRAVSDAKGNLTTVPVWSRSGGDLAAVSGRFSVRGPAAVLAVDEQFRLSKLSNDTAAMERILSDDFFETNQNGNSRDKTQALVLWKTFPIQSLQTTRALIRLAGSVAIVSGEQTEVNGTGVDSMLFTRVYTKAGADDWKLVSSSQFRNPNASGVGAAGK